jgi:hypothetical protein
VSCSPPRSWVYSRSEPVRRTGPPRDRRGPLQSSPGHSATPQICVRSSRPIPGIPMKSRCSTACFVNPVLASFLRFRSSHSRSPEAKCIPRFFRHRHIPWCGGRRAFPPPTPNCQRPSARTAPGHIIHHFVLKLLIGREHRGAVGAHSREIPCRSIFLPTSDRVRRTLGVFQKGPRACLA